MSIRLWKIKKAIQDILKLQGSHQVDNEKKLEKEIEIKSLLKDLFKLLKYKTKVSKV